MTASPPLSFSTRPKRRRWVRGVGVVLGLVALVALVVAGIAGLLWGYAWLRLGPAEIAGLRGSDDDLALAAAGPTAPDGVTTALVALVEDRDPTLRGAAPLAGPVALVQSGGARGDDVAVVLLPAALPVVVDGDGRRSLSQVHAAGGPDLLVRAVVDHTGVAVDHVVTTDTTAVPGLVGHLGPLEVCTPACVTVDEEEARRRVVAYGDASSPAALETSFADVAVLLEALATRLDASMALRSPFATRRAIDVLADGVTTDVALRGGAALPIAHRLGRAGEVAVATLPAVTNPDTSELLVLPEQAELRFALLREGGVPSGSAAEDDAAILRDVVVSVQNGTGTAGYAAALESLLTRAGVQVVGTENAASFDQATTRLRYHTEDQLGEVAAVRLAELLGGEVELDPVGRRPTFEGEPVTVTVIGGADLDDGEG